MKKVKFIYTLEIKFKVEEKVEYKVVRKYYEFEKVEKFMNNIKSLRDKDIERITITKEYVDIYE